MRLAGGVVRRVFSKNRSLTFARDGNEKNNGVEKSRWSSVRVYLCGDEFNSLIVEDDLASIKNSETTVVQPVAEPSAGEESVTVDENHETDHEESTKDEEDSSVKFSSQENAAIIIQSAFRGLLARRKYKEVRQSANENHSDPETPCGTFGAASNEAQMGESVENLQILERGTAIQHRVLHKSRSQVCRPKEEWDDSTVSSNVLKLRIQNRLEAMTRRERALAYAFSQQLRICSTKKKPTQCDSTGSSIGWSWLERWMATRMPENNLVEDCLSKHFETIGNERRTTILAKRFDAAAEEKESCGSNDVSVDLGNFMGPHHSPKNGYERTKNRLKAARNVSRRKTVPDYHCSAHTNKVSKRDFQREAEKEKKYKQVNSICAAEIKSKDACQVASGH